MLDSVEFTNGLKAYGNYKPRANALSPAMLSRVIYQPSFLYFLAVAEDLSVRSASRRLGVASSAITRQVAQLENALGVDLFDRVHQRLSLTAAGNILLHHTKQIFKPLEAAISALEGLRRRTSTSVAIAAIESVGMSLMPDVVSGFRQKQPNLAVDVTVDTSSSVFNLLVMNQVDVGITMFVKVPDGLRVVVQQTFPFGAIFAPNHPLSAKTTVTSEDMKTYPCAVVVNGLADEIGLVARLVDGGGKGITPLMQTNSVQIPIGLALLGGYVALMTPLSVRQELKEGKLAFRPLADPDLLEVRMGVFVREDQVLSPAATAFLSYLATHLKATRLTYGTGFVAGTEG